MEIKVDYDKYDEGLFLILRNPKFYISCYPQENKLTIILTKQEADEISAKIDFARQDQEITKEI